MTNSKADLWRRAKEILADALAIPPSGRAAFVEARCAGDTALCDDVFSLLKHAENATDFIERSPVIAARGLSQVPTV